VEEVGGVLGYSDGGSQGCRTVRVALEMGFCGVRVVYGVCAWRGWRYG